MLYICFGCSQWICSRKIYFAVCYFFISLHLFSDIRRQKKIACSFFICLGAVDSVMVQEISKKLFWMYYKDSSLDMILFLYFCLRFLFPYNKSRFRALQPNSGCDNCIYIQSEKRVLNWTEQLVINAMKALSFGHRQLTCLSLLHVRCKPIKRGTCLDSFANSDTSLSLSAAVSPSSRAV